MQRLDRPQTPHDNYRRDSIHSDCIHSHHTDPPATTQSITTFNPPSDKQSLHRPSHKVRHHKDVHPCPQIIYGKVTGPGLGLPLRREEEEEVRVHVRTNADISAQHTHTLIQHTHTHTHTHCTTHALLCNTLYAHDTVNRDSSRSPSPSLSLSLITSSGAPSSDPVNDGSSHRKKATMLSRGWTRATARNSQYMVATPRTSRQTEGWGRTKGPFLEERGGR